MVFDSKSPYIGGHTFDHRMFPATDLESNCLKTVQVRKQLEKENREIKTEFEIKNMELRQLQDKAASYENENERFQRSLLEAHQKLADERVKSEAKERGSFFKIYRGSNITIWMPTLVSDYVRVQFFHHK